MKLQPNVGCVEGVTGHVYIFQTVYRPGHGNPEIESVLGMCGRCGDIYLQPVTRLERLREDRDDEEGADLRSEASSGSLGLNTRMWSNIGGTNVSPGSPGQSHNPRIERTVSDSPGVPVGPPPSTRRNW